ncbi:SGNH/GDSL hydrolase family protein [Rhodococcus antarcticus]|uniref:SGNH/GDSL hydrolase family protein n=1 Tax=Rhodococcus antarcticus TaxID=2987751 RepID=A0ABY6P2R5_9NOCA|nr:SGNH/GDSL hydrolase family protein [Rhodococcus antarcticus]UZJ25936.1 SGNH/GDSL hydrolase family protein [Rhodococcus antarcticus]
MSGALGVAAAAVLVAALGAGCAGGATPAVHVELPPSPTTGSVVSLVGLGDSIPAGDECDGCTPFVELYGKQLARAASARVDVTNLGVGGWTSSDLLVALQPGGDDAAAVAGADVVTVTIGANDFSTQLDSYLAGDCGGSDGLGCFQPYLPQLRSTLVQVLREITALRAGQPTRIVVTGYWNVFPDGEVAQDEYGPGFLTASAALTTQVNSVIASAAAEQGAAYADLATPFKGVDGEGDPTGLLAADGEHPDQAGHQAIADALVALGPLTPVPAA